MNIHSATPALTAALLCALASPTARADAEQCTVIDTLPTVITSQGVYCLDRHLTSSLASGAGITVATNNVTIDCHDFKLGNLAAGPATYAVGIRANLRENVTVRRCGLRGWRAGVVLSEGIYRVEDNRIDQNHEAGLFVGGDGSQLRRNEIALTGYSDAPGITSVRAIQAVGDVDLIDNTVTDVVAPVGSGATVYGIITNGNDAGTIDDNRVRNLAADGAGFRRGIWNTDSRRLTLKDNVVVMSGASLVTGEAGIRCGSSVALLNGATRDNTVLGVGVGGLVHAIVNCTPVSGDFVNPL